MLRGEFKDCAGSKEDQKPPQDEGELEPVVGGLTREECLDGVASGHPPHRDKAQRHGYAADEDIGSPSPPAGSRVVSEMPHDRVGDCVPKSGNDHDGSQPKGTQSERNITEQSHQLPRDVEQGNRDQASHAVGDQLIPRDAVFLRGRVLLVCRHIRS